MRDGVHLGQAKIVKAVGICIRRAPREHLVETFFRAFRHVTPLVLDSSGVPFSFAFAFAKQITLALITWLRQRNVLDLVSARLLVAA